MKRNTEHRRSNKKIIAMLSVLTVLALAVIGYSVSGTVACKQVGIDCQYIHHRGH